MTDYLLHPDMLELVAAKQAKPAGFDPLIQRQGHDRYGATLARPYPPDMEVYDRRLACGQAGREDGIEVRVYRPGSAAQPTPCVVYLHGGGFVLGSLESGDTVAWGIAAQSGAIVVSVDYRLAPEHPFPAAPEDCYAAVRSLAEHADELGVDAERIAVWGDSAGGNLCVATCLMARERGTPAIAAQVAVYPILAVPGTLPSHRTHAHSPGLTLEFMRKSWAAYVGDTHPVPGYAAPLNAADLSGLPPAHVHIAEYDPLADDGRMYAQRLLAAGGDVELHCARHMIHGFARARFSGEDAAAEFESICRFVRARLRRSS